MILLNPGPVNVSPRVTAALGRGDMCHREPACAELLDRVRGQLLQAFAPAGGFRAVLVTGSGTAALETAVSSACSATGRMVVIENGVYGERIHAMADAARIPVTPVVRSDWASPPDLAAVEQAVAASDVEVVAIVHHETTSGLRNPVAEIGAIARRHGKRLLVDSVSGLAGDALDLDAVGADFVVGTANKCIQGLPGLSFVLVREAVVPQVLTHPRRSLYLSLGTYLEKPMPFTPAVQAAYAFDEALTELLAEGVARRIARYAAAAAILREGFAQLGLAFLLPPEWRSNSITAVRFPPGTTYAALHAALVARGYVIYEGQGWLAKEVFRVANMGAHDLDVFRRFLVDLGEVLDR